MRIKRTKMALYAILAAMMISLILLYITQNEIFLLVETLCLVLFIFVWLVFWRCPHCGKQLGREVGKHCRGCGKSLNK